MLKTTKNMAIANLETVKISLKEIDELYELLTDGMKVPESKLSELMKAKTALENAAVHLTNFVKVAASIRIDASKVTRMVTVGNEGAELLENSIAREDWIKPVEAAEIAEFFSSVQGTNQFPAGKLRREPIPGTEAVYEKVKESLLIGPDSLVVFKFTFVFDTHIVLMSPDTMRGCIIGGVNPVVLYWVLCGIPSEEKLTAHD